MLALLSIEEPVASYEWVAFLAKMGGGAGRGRGGGGGAGGGGF